MTHPRTILALTLLLATVSFGCAAKPTASAAVTAEVAPVSAPAAVAPAAPREAPVTFEGKRQENTRPFPLAGGAYTVAWEVPVNPDRFACFVGVTMDGTAPPAGSQVTRSFTAISKTVEPGAVDVGETQLYQVPAGDYYLKSKTSGACSWSVTITPQ